MISIQSSLTELERSHHLRGTVLECYLAAIQNMAHYAVDLDTETTGPHKRYLTALAEELKAAHPDALAESRSTLRGLLRDYRDRAAQYLNRLRDQLNSTAQALQETVEALAQADGDHSGKVRTALQRLRDVADSPEGAPVRKAVGAAADSITLSLEEMRKQHQFTVSQFQTEMRLLHGRIDSLEAAAAIDEATKFFNRRFMEEYIRSLPSEGASVLLLQISGMAEAKARYGPSMGDDLIATFGRRLRNSVPKEALVGRWNEQSFLAAVPAGAAREAVQPVRIAEHLSASYACMQGGKVVRIPMKVTVEHLSGAATDSPQRILDSITQAFG